MGENTDKTKAQEDAESSTDNEAVAESEEALSDAELDGVAGGASTKSSVKATNIKATSIKTKNIKVSPIVGQKPVAMEHSCSDEKG